MIIFITYDKHFVDSCSWVYLSFIDPEQGVFGEIFLEVMIFPEGFSPREISSLKEIFHRIPRARVYKCFIIPKNTLIKKESSGSAIFNIQNK
jgi:hypothetical protein